jgi:hypothetical protein
LEAKELSLETAGNSPSLASMDGLAITWNSVAWRVFTPISFGGDDHTSARAHDGNFVRAIRGCSISARRRLHGTDSDAGLSSHFERAETSH